MLLGYFIGASAIGTIIFLVRNRVLNYALSILFLFAQATVAVYAWLHIGESDSAYFTFDALGVILCIVLTILCFSTFYHSHIYLNRHKGNPRTDSIYYASLIMLITGMTGAYFADHLNVLWAMIEATTLFVSVLIYHERTAISLEATWKYLFICSLGTALAFIGILFVSAMASEGGMTDLDINTLVTQAQFLDPTWLKIIFILAVTGFSAKMGLVPFYTVCVDAHTAAPPPISAFISTTLMNVGFLGIYRMYSIIAQSEAHAWGSRVLMIAGIFSITLSAIQLVRVKHFKRMFAFSSLEHMGIVAIAMAAGGIGYYAAVLHIVLHSFTKASLFYQIGQVENVFRSYFVKDSGNYMKLNPLGAIVVILAFLGISAIPPSGMFVSELMVFKALFAGSHYIIAGLAFLMMTLIIYIFGKNLLHLVYNVESKVGSLAEVSINRGETISQYILLGLVIWLGFFQPRFFSDLIISATSILN
jgi:hydrogenase-4 component F